MVLVSSFKCHSSCSLLVLITTAKLSLGWRSRRLGRGVVWLLQPVISELSPVDT